MIRRALFALFLLAAAAPAAAQPGEPAPAPAAAPAPAGPVLRPGDSVRVTVWRKPELSGGFAVRSDGSIGSALYGAVRVAGLGMDDVEQQVRAQVLRYENEPRVFVEPLFRVAVAGEVRRPGLYTFGPSTTLAQAVMLAGGSTERGRLDRVTLVRDGRREVLNLEEPGAARALAPIHSGDEIAVPRRRSVFRETLLPAATLAGAAAAILNAISRI